MSPSAPENRLFKSFLSLFVAFVCLCTASAASVSKIMTSPSSVTFGATQVNTSSAPQSVTITNNSRQPLSITRIAPSRSEFSLQLAALPIELEPGAAATIQVTFRPDSARRFSGLLLLSGRMGNGNRRFIEIAVSGIGTTASTSHPTSVAPTITTQPISASANVGSRAKFVGVASGGQPLAYQWQRNGVNIDGATTSSYTTPAVTTADNGADFDLVVSNSAGSATSAQARLLVTASSPSASSPAIRVSPAAVSFGSVSVGSSISQTVSIANSGTGALHVSSITETGAAFHLNAPSLPATISAGQQLSLTVAFHPTMTGQASGAISIADDAITPTVSLTLSGTGAAVASTLAVSPATLDFGDVKTGATSASQNVTVMNTGSSSVTISKIATSGTGFAVVSGGGTPVTLAPAQSIILQAAFTPSSEGATTGSIVVSSNATTPTASVGLAGDGTTTTKAAWVFGVTTDDPTVNTSQQVDALSSFAQRVMVRTVFDPPAGGSPTAADYVPSVTSISGVADVMGLMVDSSEMSNMTLATVQARATEYLNALGNVVSVWEIGNEVNGNWLGAGVLPKIEAMYDTMKAAGKQTALTVYYENPATAGFDMLPWIDANIPPGHRMRTGLDYILVSYYEDENNGHQLTQTELNTIFSGLAGRFPNAKVGFGEFGWGEKIPPAGSGDATRAALIRRFTGYRVPTVPAYIGAGFYWDFRQTMVPKSDPDWTVFDTLIQNFQ
jgi:hypothetical protein